MTGVLLSLRRPFNLNFKGFFKSGVIPFGWLAGLFCLSILVSCASEDQGPKPKREFRGPVYEKQLGPLEKLLSDAPLSIAKSIEQVSIGLISMVVEGNPSSGLFSNGQCTGFLVDFGSHSDSQFQYVATNSHCITDTVLVNRKLCSKYLGIKFPKSSLQGDLTEDVQMCEEIVYVSQDPELGALSINEDLAIFKIKNTHRAAFKAGKTSTEDSQILRLMKIDPTSVKDLGGEFSEANCRVTMNSLLLQEFTHGDLVTGLLTTKDIDVVEPMKPCYIVNGNSGSPVLNQGGEVVGVAQSYYSERFIEIIESIELGFQLMVGDIVRYEFPREIPHHVHYTHIHCFEMLGGKIKLSEQCKSDAEDLTTEDIISQIENEAKAAITPEYLNQELVPRLEESVPHWIKSKTIKVGDYSYAIQPQCYFAGKLPEVEESEQNFELILRARARLVIPHDGYYVRVSEQVEIVSQKRKIDYEMGADLKSSSPYIQFFEVHEEIVEPDFTFSTQEIEGSPFPSDYSNPDVSGLPSDDGSSSSMMFRDQVFQLSPCIEDAAE